MYTYNKQKLCIYIYIYKSSINATIQPYQFLCASGPLRHQPRHLARLLRVVGVGGVVKLENANFNTWPFQEPKLEVPTIYKAHVGLCKGISPQNMALYGTVTVPPFSQLFNTWLIVVLEMSDG